MVEQAAHEEVAPGLEEERGARCGGGGRQRVRRAHRRGLCRQRGQPLAPAHYFILPLRVYLEAPRVVLCNAICWRMVVLAAKVDQSSIAEAQSHLTPVSLLIRPGAPPGDAARVRATVLIEYVSLRH